MSDNQSPEQSDMQQIEHLQDFPDTMPTLMTIRRMTNGKLLPFVDGKQIPGCVDVAVSTNGSQQLVQFTFHTAFVMFETERNPICDKLT